MVFQNDILAGASGTAAGYTIDQSIRFNDDDTAYMTRTPSSNGNRKTFTWSGWVKIGAGAIASNSYLLATTGGASDSGYFTFYINQTYNSLSVTGYSTVWKRTSQVFRDPSAWYHIVIRVDSTNATADDRIRIYVNGEQVTSFAASSNPALNHDFGINTTSNTTYLFSESPQGGGPTSDKCWDGYGAEINFIDGQALAPTEFGEFNDDGVWVPKAYAGTYGTNGFYITGEDSADLGADYSGNGNDFTSSGLTASDQMPDSPTDNYCTLNPLTGVNAGSSVVTEANGNLEGTMTANYVGTFGTLGANSGKYYFEYSYAADGNYNDGRLYGGVVCVETADHSYFRIDGGSFYRPDKVTEGNYMIKHLNGSGEQSNTGTSTIAYNTNLSSASATGGPESGPDIYMVAMDLDNNNLYWGKNGTWYGASGTSGSNYTDATPIAILAAHQGKYFAPAFGFYGAASGTTTVLNCGQDATFGGRYSSPVGDFYYTPPTGFSKLSTANLPEPTIKDGSAYFNTILYTGDGSATTRSFTGVGFQPDFVWKKIRSSADHHWLHDAVRGADKGLNSNRIDSEYTSTRLTSFDSDGFSFATSDPDTNGSGSTYVAWNWLAGNGTASNTDGTITSTVSVNQTAGFSIVSWTATGTGSDTIGHGLGVQPSMVIKKERSASDSWFVQNINYTSGAYSQFLEGTQAQTSSAAYWNSTFPTSTVFSQGTVMNSGNTCIAYCWAEVDGFSKFGKYTGNGSADGPFVWCGFRPAFILVKEYTSADDWLIYDSSRDPYNVAGRVLRPDSTAAEFDGRGGSRDVDFLSNGFKFRSSNATMNGSGAGYIFMAFAEHPFGGSGVAPVPSR